MKASQLIVSKPFLQESEKTGNAIQSSQEQDKAVLTKNINKLSKETKESSIKLIESKQKYKKDNNILNNYIDSNNIDSKIKDRIASSNKCSNKIPYNSNNISSSPNNNNKNIENNKRNNNKNPSNHQQIKKEKIKKIINYSNNLNSNSGQENISSNNCNNINRNVNNINSNINNESGFNTLEEQDIYLPNNFNIQYDKNNNNNSQIRNNRNEINENIDYHDTFQKNKEEDYINSYQNINLENSINNNNINTLNISNNNNSSGNINNSNNIFSKNILARNTEEELRLDILEMKNTIADKDKEINEKNNKIEELNTKIANIITMDSAGIIKFYEEEFNRYAFKTDEFIRYIEDNLEKLFNNYNNKLLSIYSNNCNSYNKNLKNNSSKSPYNEEELYLNLYRNTDMLKLFQKIKKENDTMRKKFENLQHIERISQVYKKILPIFERKINISEKNFDVTNKTNTQKINSLVNENNKLKDEIKELKRFQQNITSNNYALEFGLHKAAHNSNFHRNDSYLYGGNDNFGLGFSLNNINNIGNINSISGIGNNPINNLSNSTNIASINPVIGDNTKKINQTNIANTGINSNINKRNKDKNNTGNYINNNNTNDITNNDNALQSSNNSNINNKLINNNNNLNINNPNEVNGNQPSKKVKINTSNNINSAKISNSNTINLNSNQSTNNNLISNQINNNNNNINNLVNTNPSPNEHKEKIVSKQKQKLPTSVNLIHNQNNYSINNLNSLKSLSFHKYDEDSFETTHLTLINFFKILNSSELIIKNKAYLIRNTLSEVNKAYKEINSLTQIKNKFNNSVKEIVTYLDHGIIQFNFFEKKSVMIFKFTYSILVYLIDISEKIFSLNKVFNGLSISNLVSSNLNSNSSAVNNASSLSNNNNTNKTTTHYYKNVSNGNVISSSNIKQLQSQSNQLEVILNEVVVLNDFIVKLKEDIMEKYGVDLCKGYLNNFS